MPKLKGVFGACVLAVAMAAGGNAFAQDNYPDRPITLIVPYGPGGGVSINARALTPYLGKALGQDVVVVNRTGAGGVTGHTIGAMAKPDGYTLTMVSPGIVAAPLLIKGVRFSPKSFRYIGQVTFVPNLLAVRADSPYKTLADLVQAMKKNPGKIAIGRANGWPSDDVAEAVFLARANVKAKVITGMSGGAEKDKDLLGGQLGFVIGNINELLPLYKAGKVRILAAAAPKRSPLLPQVPTFKEQGYDVTIGVWRTLAAPAGTPQKIVDTLNSALQKALKNPALKKDFKRKALTVDYLGPKQTRQRVMSDYQELSQIFTKMGIDVQSEKK